MPMIGGRPARAELVSFSPMADDSDLLAKFCRDLGTLPMLPSDLTPVWELLESRIR